MKKLFYFFNFTQISCEKEMNRKISDNNETNSLIEVTVFMFELCPVAQYDPPLNLHEGLRLKYYI